MKRDQWTICCDTLCEGFQPVLGDDGPLKFATEAAAQTEIDSDKEFYDGCFACEVNEIGHKVFYYPKAS